MTAAVRTLDSVAPSRPAVARPQSWIRERGMGATILVAAISAAFGVMLLSAIEYVSAVIRAIPGAEDNDTVRTTLTIVGIVFIAIAMYVGGMVTANTFSTVVAGRVRRIALLRLLGSSARRERTTIARQGLILGAIGAVLGLLGGLLVSVLASRLASAAWNVDPAWNVLRPDLLAPVLAVIAVTWLAAWTGSRRVIAVTPLQALSQAAEPSRDAVRSRRGRHVAALSLFLVGLGILGLGLLLGLVSPFGLLIAVPGGALSFGGVALGSTLFVPPALRAVGRLFGRSAVARMAAANAVRYSERSSRMVVGVVMGVGLVTLFAVGGQSSVQFLQRVSPDDLPDVVVQAIDIFTAVTMGLVAVSAVIAAVGVVNLLTLGVLQRRREFGLLRALGLSQGQVRGMVLLESVHVVVTAVGLGLLLGTFYGWAGAQALWGWVPLQAHLGDPAIIVPAIPPVTVAIVIAATAVLTVVASVVPTRLATRISPVRALA